jgi:hypothetical protein
MTHLYEPALTSPTTQSPSPPRQLPALDAARDFYLRGAAREIHISFIGRDGVPQDQWWARSVERAVNELFELPDGWDGPKSAQVSDLAATSALTVLAQLLVASGARLLPQLFPLHDGGIQAEWHAGGDDIEIEVDRDGRVHIILENRDGEVIDEGLLGDSSEHDARLLGNSVEFLKRLDRRVLEAQVTGGASEGI